MDILKVGKSLGIGSIAMWIADSAQRVEKTDSVDCRIISNGAIQSSVKTNYYGWNNNKYNLTSILTINAGSRLTKCDLTPDQNPDNMCTGIVRLDSTEVLNPSNSGTWNYYGTYGKQSLNNDKLGMAVLFKNNELLRFSEDKHSHVIVLKPQNDKLTYYFLAAWEKEPEGITTKKQKNNLFLT